MKKALLIIAAISFSSTALLSINQSNIHFLKGNIEALSDDEYDCDWGGPKCHCTTDSMSYSECSANGCGNACAQKRRHCSEYDQNCRLPHTPPMPY